MAKYNTNGSSALAPNDPYQDMDRPNFRVVNGSKSNDSTRPNLKVIDGGKSNPAQNSAKNLLRQSEDSSIIPFDKNRGETADSPWKNSVQGKPLTANIPGTKGIKFTTKKKSLAVLITILTLLIGGGVFLSSSNVLLPGALSSLFTSQTNSGYAGYTLRSAKLTSYMLRNLDTATTTGITGRARYTHMSSSFRQRLENNNIKVNGSGSDTTLTWTKTTAHGAEEITIGASAFQSEYLNNAEFRADYDTARRGRIATFFDTTANKVYQKLGLSRNNFKDYKNTGDSEVDTENYNKIMTDQLGGNQTDINTRAERDKIVTKEYETDSRGNILKNADGTPKEATSSSQYKTTVEVTDGTERYLETDASTTASNNNSADSANNQARSYVSDLANKVGRVANGACSLMKFGNAISITLAALEKAAALRVFLNPMENVSKMMGGAGDSSAINEVLNYLTTSVETTTYLYDQGISYSGIDTENLTASSSATSSIAEKTVTGAPIQAQGFQKILGGQKNVSSSIVNYSSERISSSLSKSLGMSRNTMITCLGIQGGVALTSLVISLIPVVGQGFSAIKITTDFIWKLTKGVAIGFAAMAIMSFAIPTIANLLFRNVFESIVGIPAGELFATGAANVNFRNGQNGSGQIPASKESVLQYNKSVKQVAALDAEVDRLTLSPFDISSPNTFLGSIAYSTILPTLTSQNNTISTISSIIRTTAKSISTITGSVSADGEDSTYMTTFGNDLGSCPQLDEMGYACDIYGNFIPISTLINIEPDDPNYNQFIDENTNDDGSIKDGEYLSKFLIANVNRESSIGVVDTNILGNIGLSNNPIINNPITGSLPIIGDAIDLWNAAEDATNLGFADGTYIGDSPNNTEYHMEALYAQRYIEDNRILDMISSDSEVAATYENPITAYLNKYEEEHPLDNSTAGYISRITGLPKDTAETVLAMVEYYEFLNNYDTSTLIAMTEENTTIQSSDVIIARFESTKIDFSKESESEINEEILLAKQSEQYIIYADTRNRSFAA